MMWELLTGEVPYKGIDDVAIAYGVATNKYELHIPSTCPEQWQELMKSCWIYDHEMRPSFKDILKNLDDIARTDFHQMPNDNFYSLQDNWKAEIDDRLNDIRLREDVSCQNQIYFVLYHEKTYHYYFMKNEYNLKFKLMFFRSLEAWKLN